MASWKTRYHTPPKMKKKAQIQYALSIAIRKREYVRPRKPSQFRPIPTQILFLKQHIRIRKRNRIDRMTPKRISRRLSQLQPFQRKRGLMMSTVSYISQHSPLSVACRGRMASKRTYQVLYPICKCRVLTTNDDHNLIQPDECSNLHSQLFFRSVRTQ